MIQGLPAGCHLFKCRSIRLPHEGNVSVCHRRLLAQVDDQGGRVLVICHDEGVHLAVGLQSGDARHVLEDTLGLYGKDVLVLLDNLCRHDLPVGQVRIGEFRWEDHVRGECRRHLQGVTLRVAPEAEARQRNQC